MDRRTFTGRLAAALALPFPVTLAPAPRRPILPARLRVGDTVGLITPGSFLPDTGLQRAVTQVEGLGLRVKLGTHVRAERGYLAGTDAERLADLHAMFADDSVRAIWCARGGYGCGRLLPLLDLELIRAHPKLLIGYSDVTALLNYISRQTGMVTYHGPVASSKLTPYTRERFLDAVLEGRKLQAIRPSEEGEAAPYVIRPGKAEGCCGEET